MKRPARSRRREAKAKRKRGTRFSDIVGYSAVVGLVLVTVYLLAPQISLPQIQLPQSPTTQTLRAAIVDQLSAVSSGTTWVDSVRGMLLQRGFTVDVYLPSDVTVEFYRTLPTHGYKLIVLRVHTGIGDPKSQVPIGLFTSDPYDSNRYVIEQATARVGAAQINDKSPVVFAVTPKFIRDYMRGDFGGAIIVLGGCFGVRNSDLSQAFISRGVRVVVGWTDLVDLTHTDKGILRFLEEFLVKKKTIQQAVDVVMQSIGPDPTYGAELSYFGEDLSLVVSPVVLVVRESKSEPRIS